MKFLRNTFFAVLVVVAAGCGSVSSRWNGNYGPYVGVKVDVDTITHYQSEGELIAIADIPLSAVMDTIFLPYDLTRPKRDASTQVVSNANEPPAAEKWVPVNPVPAGSSAESNESKSKKPSSGRIGYR